VLQPQTQAELQLGSISFAQQLLLVIFSCKLHW
jgi:hypothetical protein